MSTAAPVLGSESPIAGLLTPGGAVTTLIKPQAVEPICSLVGPNGFTIRVRSKEQAIVITLTGELDLATAPMLHDALDLVGQMGISQVAVDAENLSFIDACGLGVLVSARNDQRARAGTLVIRYPSVMLVKATENHRVDRLGRDSSDRRPGATLRSSAARATIRASAVVEVTPTSGTGRAALGRRTDSQLQPQLAQGITVSRLDPDDR